MEKNTDRAYEVVEKMKRFGQPKDLLISCIGASEICREQHSDPISKVEQANAVR